MSENQAQTTVEARMSGEQKRIENLKRQAGLFEENKIRKKKQKTGKNPLSWLKSKKKSTTKETKESVNQVK